MGTDVLMFFAVPLIAFAILVVPAAIHYALKRTRQPTEATSPAKSAISIELQSIPLREITTVEGQQQAKAKPYVRIQAPYRTSTASSPSTIVKYDTGGMVG